VGLSVSSHDEYLAGKKSDLNFWQSRCPNPYNSLYPSLSLFSRKRDGCMALERDACQFSFSSRARQKGNLNEVIFPFPGVYLLEIPFVVCQA